MFGSDFGICKSFGAAENLRRLEDFAAASNDLPCDEATARLMGKIKTTCTG